MAIKRNKPERVTVVLTIARKLKAFPMSTGAGVLDLYNSQFPAMVELRRVFQDYINQDDARVEQLRGASGKIAFPEISRVIEYIIPIHTTRQPHFVLKGLKDQRA